METSVLNPVRSRGGSRGVRSRGATGVFYLSHSSRFCFLNWGHLPAFTNGKILLDKNLSRAPLEIGRCGQAGSSLSSHTLAFSWSSRFHAEHARPIALHPVHYLFTFPLWPLRASEPLLYRFPSSSWDCYSTKLTWEMLTHLPALIF